MEFKEGTEAFIESLINRGLKKGIYKQRITGEGDFYLKNTPLLEVISLKVNGEEVKNYIYDEDCLYYDTNGQEKTVIVEYVGGFERIPADIQSVIIKAVARQYRDYKDETYNIANLKEGTVSMTYIDKAILTEEEKNIVIQYRYFNM